MKLIQVLARKMLEEVVFVESTLLVLCFAASTLFMRSLDLPVAKGAEATIPILGIASILFVTMSFLVLIALFLASGLSRKT